MGTSASAEELPIKSAPVVLHVYDMGLDTEVHALNRILRALGTGAFHCGVEIYGKEWSYRGMRATKGTGVFWCKPRNCEGHAYLESIVMGNCRMSELDVVKLLRHLESEWPGTGYDILKRNCCHFSDTLCICMGVGPIPTWVTNLAGTGAAIADTGEYLDRRRKTVTNKLVEEVDAHCWTDIACAAGVCSLGCLPEMCAQGKTLQPSEFEKELIDEYRQQLIAKLPRSL